MVRKTPERTISGGVIANPYIIQPELLDVLPDLCFVLNREGMIVQANANAAHTLRRPKAILLNTDFSALVEPEFRERFDRAFQRCFSSDPGLAEEISLRSGDDGAVQVVLRLARYALPGARQEEACLVTARDITEAKRQELELLRFFNVAQYTVNPLEITDRGGKIIYVNPAFEKASGYAKEELIGKNPSVFGSGKHPKRFWEAMWKEITSGNVWVGEIENKRRNGEPFFTHLLISPIIDAKGEIIGFFGVHRDITQQRNLEQQLIQAQKMESIGLLAAGLAHEVGNPLTSISSLVQLLQRESKDRFTLDKLELIKSQISRISRIIRDLVDFSRRSSYEVQLTDVNKRLQEAVEIVRVGKKAKEMSFRASLAEGLTPLPLVPDQIEQVFINMLINAVDAIHEDAASNEPGKKRRGEIVVTSALRDGDVVITIGDNGKGIAEKDIAKIFEAFYTTKKVGEGTGLGLWVSYGIIKSFQGTITVQSREGEGTTFTITLPTKS